MKMIKLMKSNLIITLIFLSSCHIALAQNNNDSGPCIDMPAIYFDKCSYLLDSSELNNIENLIILCNKHNDIIKELTIYVSIYEDEVKDCEENIAEKRGSMIENIFNERINSKIHVNALYIPFNDIFQDNKYRISFKLIRN